MGAGATAVLPPSAPPTLPPSPPSAPPSSLALPSWPEGGRIVHEIVLDLLTISLPEEPATAGSVVDGIRAGISAAGQPAPLSIHILQQIAVLVSNMTDAGSWEAALCAAGDDYDASGCSAVRQSRRRRSLGEDSSSWEVRATLRRGSSRRVWQPPDYGGLVEEATLTAVVVRCS